MAYMYGYYYRTPIEKCELCRGYYQGFACSCALSKKFNETNIDARILNLRIPLYFSRINIINRIVSMKKLFKVAHKFINQLFINQSCSQTNRCDIK